MPLKQSDIARVEQEVVDVEEELLRDRFIDFERDVLQDNVLLCDTKAGLLLAFTGAMVLFCMDAIANVHEAAGGHPVLTLVTKALLVLAAAGFLVSSHYSLTTVLPRFTRGRADHIFWESPVFKGPVEEYIATMQTLDLAILHDDKLRHLHLLARICGNKYGHFQTAMRLNRLAFLALVLGEAIRSLA